MSETEKEIKIIDRDITAPKEGNVSPLSNIKTVRSIPPLKSTNENYELLKSCSKALCQDYEKFNNKKIKAAGQRTRNNLLNMKKLCDQLRKQILTEMQEIPIKSRIPKEKSEVKSENEVKEGNVSSLCKISSEKKPRAVRKANKVKTVSSL